VKRRRKEKNHNYSKQVQCLHRCENKEIKEQVIEVLFCLHNSSI
jgi:hypothetical protein